MQSIYKYLSIVIISESNSREEFKASSTELEELSSNCPNCDKWTNNYHYKTRPFVDISAIFSQEIKPA